MLLTLIGVFLSLLLDLRKDDGEVAAAKSYEYDWQSIDKLADDYLSPFKAGFTAPDFEATANHVLDPAYGRGASVIVQVLNQTIWVDMSTFTTPYPWDRLRLHHVLGRLKAFLAKHKVSDFEFLLNTHDCPIRNLAFGSVPIFTMTKCRGMPTVPLPQWNRWRDGQWLGWDKRVKRYAEAGWSVPWLEKDPRAIFLGSIRPSCLQWHDGRLSFVNLTADNWREIGRTHLYHLSGLRPDLLEVGLFGKGVEASRLLLDLMGQEWQYKPPLSMSEQAAQYRHALVVEGACGWADRLKAQMAMGMTILMQETPCQEWFIPLLRDGEHLLQLRNNLTDTAERIEWLQQHPTEAYEMGQRGAQMMATLLGQAGWDRYFAQVMLGYSQLPKYIPQRRKGVKRFVKETDCPNQRNYRCDDTASFR